MNENEKKEEKKKNWIERHPFLTMVGVTTVIVIAAHVIKGKLNSNKNVIPAALPDKEPLVEVAQQAAETIGDRVVNRHPNYHWRKNFNGGNRFSTNNN